LIDVEPEEFFIIRNRWIWEAYGSVKSIDYVTIVDYLRSKNKLDEIGGPAYVTALLNACPISTNAEEYAEIVRDYARRRKLVMLSNDIAKAAFNTGESVDSKTGDFINVLVEASRSSDGAARADTMLKDFYDEVENRYRNPCEVWGIPSGFQAVDRLTGGFHSSELVIISGEEGMGKSILAMQMGMQMAANAPGAIYSMEMSRMQLLRRMVSAEAKVPTRSIKTGKLEGDDWSKIIQAIEKIGGLELYISDASGWTTTSLRVIWPA
jgi:replicative DNA helicase